MERVRSSRDAPRPDWLGTEGYRDEVFALFQSIWHLKDWLINDPAAEGITKEVANGWVFGYCPRRPRLILQAAHDIANGSKHMRLDNPAVDAAQVSNDAIVHIGVGHQTVFRITIARTGQTFEAVALAEKCMEEWGDFLTEHHLRPDPS